MMRLTSLAALLALASSAPTDVRAQIFGGTVMQADSTTPALGVLVEIRSRAQPQPMRVLTSARGSFRVRLSAPDTVNVRVLRPGFRPVHAPPVFVGVGATADIRIVLEDQPLTLAAVTVRESRVCGERADAAAWQLWEQARTALQATSLTERDSSLTVRTLEFQGPPTPGGGTIVQDSTIRFVPVDAEFPRAHYDSLFEHGYIRRNSDSVTTYYAPNAHVLLDERFVMTHCFRVAERDSSPKGMIGVRFEPTRSPQTTGIVGTFWLDSTSYLLRQIEFGYLNPPVRHRVLGTGGYVLFERLGTGHWVMSEWSIRMATFIKDHHLWSRSQVIVSVRLGDQLLFHQPAGDSLALRLIPRGDSRQP